MTRDRLDRYCASKADPLGASFCSPLVALIDHVTSGRKEQKPPPVPLPGEVGKNPCLGPMR